jgi:hypothetical protein
MCIYIYIYFATIQIYIYLLQEGLKNAEIFNQAETTETGIRYLWHLCAVIYRTPHRLVHVAKTLRTVGRKT